MNSKLLSALVVAIIIFGIGKAIADGIPTVRPLTYSGVLQNSNGTAIATQQSMQLSLWDDGTANTSVNQKCVTPTQNVTPDNQGRFQVQLDQACFDAVKANPNLWVQVEVGSLVLPRSKLGAVPFSVESGRAQRVIFAANGISTTVDGVYCGASANQTGTWTANAGALTGYRAAKLLCEQTCSTRTAHACSAEEAMRSHVLRIGLPSASWVAAPGAYAFTEGGTMPTFPPKNDCAGHTDSSSAVLGSTWLASPGTAGSGYCDQSLPIACCD